METWLDNVDRLEKELKALLPMKAEDQKRLDKKFRLEFNYNSNHIEGNTLTYGETELLLIFDDTKGNHSMREYEEMKAHDVALHMIEELANDKERPLTEQFIKNLNKTILVRPYWKDAITNDGQNTRREIKVGDYKEYPNSVRLQNGELFEYANPVDTPIQMQELIEWYRADENAVHPVTLAAMLHYKFVRIHPFDDGNGRIARLLLNYVLLKNELPPVIIKSDDKVNYLRALNRADIGDYELFISYIGEQVEWSLDISIKAAKGESIEEVGDFVKEVKLLKQKVETLDFTKSPKLIMNVFLAIETKVWKKVDDTLTQFEMLFTDEKTTRYVNNIAVKSNYNDNIERLMQSGFSKIYGYDIYEITINKVSWANIMYGLKGSNDNGELEITLSVMFNTQSYFIELSENYNVLYKIEKKYDDLSLSDETDTLNKILQQHILSNIKTRIQPGKQ